MQDFPQGNLRNSEQGSVNKRTTVNDINIKPTLNLFKSPRVLDHPGKQIFRDLHFKVASLDLDSLPELPGVITTRNQFWHTKHQHHTSFGVWLNTNHCSNKETKTKERKTKTFLSTFSWLVKN